MEGWQEIVKLLVTIVLIFLVGGFIIPRMKGSFS